MLGVRLSAGSKQTMSSQVVDTEHPGPILHDFAVLLEFLGGDGVKAAGKYNLLPIDAIPILDERLSRPLRLPLKRPQLRSHPYLQGLHLLLRATGLAKVDGAGSRAKLCVDPLVAEQWHRLNATEKFFTLLEAAFLHANAVMIGESDRDVNGPFFTCFRTWQELPKAGRKFDPVKRNGFYLIYRRYYLIALCDLFGLIRIVQPSEPVVPWFPQAVYHTPFGDAFFSLLGEQDISLLMNDGGSHPFGAWQPLFQPYFSDWRENLILPKPELREGVFVFKVTLGRAVREIAIPDSLTLDDLAEAILDAVEFDHDHLYEFSFRDQFGKQACVGHPYCDEGPFTDEFPIGELPLQPGQTMTFLFDFGDNWKFNVKLERIDPPNPRMKKAKLIAEQGAAPKQYPEYEE